MQANKRIWCSFLLLIFLAGIEKSQAAEDFDSFLRPLFAAKCFKCHGGGKKVKGKVHLKEIQTQKDFLARPELIKELIEVIDGNDMPPEDEPGLEAGDRPKLLKVLKKMLAQATSGKAVGRAPARRLNRFQYNNSVRDLFRLKKDVFRLPEKLMTRQGNYLGPKVVKMPEKVEAACLSLVEEGGFRDVAAFPKDLRAAHGFDNQANQLTLSPLLLDAFLRLSVSILESPDFTRDNVGAWDELFKEPPAGADLDVEVSRRLEPFLKGAFRGTPDRDTLKRYTNYGLSKIKQGTPFTAAMKKVASAALSSPLFLYRYSSEKGKGGELELASNLSFFLWGSSPDLELLRLAESGELAKPATLQKTMDRMLADPKVERFLDNFPAQWMQLENLLAVTPDPNKHRLFTLDKKNPASLQMVLEPLLLFDAVFVENRPIVELIAPEFSYQSDFLKTWYTSDLKAPKIDNSQRAEQNRAWGKQRKELAAAIKTARSGLDGLIKPVRERLLAKRKKEIGAGKSVDLKPYAAWEFNGDLKCSLNSLHLKAHGKVQHKDGMVVLNKSYLQSPNLAINLKAKTLEVWFKIPDVNQRGGGVMGTQGPGDFFDTIVLGERKPRHWISGSDRFNRTLDFPGSTPEEKPNQLLHLAMVYRANGETLLYRNGKPYGKPFRKGRSTFPKNRSSIIFGARHLPANGNRYLSVSIDKARFYDRALTAEEVAASSSGASLYISGRDFENALTAEQRKKRDELNRTIRQTEVALKRVPKDHDLRKPQQDAQRRFDDEIRNKLRSRSFQRVAAKDPRYGGVITSAAMLSMTSGPRRTHPIARGAWIIEVILNDPPPPPPNDVPPLNEDDGPQNLTIREKFAKHRENPDCAGCHSRLDPLGFALENFDITGRWRDKYENGRKVDPSGKLMKKHEFDGIVRFKGALVKEKRRFARAFTAHLLRFALSRELHPADSLTVDAIVEKAAKDDFKLKSLIREVILSDSFLQNR
ncbi:MAG: DUF1588 domain-containing protein [Planctomycetota bacterium]|nr:DUF1588 domain-containing protein [Planctomycetota bacterium]